MIIVVGSTFEARHQNGFTLIEVLVVTVIIGMLAAIAIPKFSKIKEKAYMAAMKSDLRNLITVQEEYFANNSTYTTDKVALNFTESAGGTVTIVVTAGPPVGFSATSLHTATASTCAIYVATAPVAPANNEGEPKCT